uniref:DALR domain-containing protein n=1 Tax=Pseudomonas putida TaxID=303 RepID=UPI0035590B73
MDWNTQRLQSAVQTLIRLYTSLSKVSSLPAPADVALDDQVLNSLKNDLGVNEALARLHVIRAELDQAGTDEMRSLNKARLLKSAGLLGLLQQEPHAALAALSPPQ